MNTENPTPHFEFPADPDYGVWTRAVERVVDLVMVDEGIDWWPSESLVATLVEELGLTDPDEGDQMEIFEDELREHLGTN